MVTTTEDPGLYPVRFEVFYGRGVWATGDDGVDGLIAEGHGRRALAAINAHERTSRGYAGWAQVDGFPGVELRWVTFAETCGCTVELHDAQHLDEDGDTDFDKCDSACDHPGLPPCEPDRFEWVIETTAEHTSGAVPITAVTW